MTYEKINVDYITFQVSAYCFFRFMALRVGIVNSAADVEGMGEEETYGLVNKWVAITADDDGDGFVP